MRRFVAPPRRRLIVDHRGDADAGGIRAAEEILELLRRLAGQHDVLALVGLPVRPARRFGVGEVRDGDFDALALRIEGAGAGVDGGSERRHTRAPSGPRRWRSAPAGTWRRVR